MQTVIRTLFTYNQWAHDRVWPGILTLDDERFTRAFEYSIGSVRTQIVHVLSVDHRWLMRVSGQPVPPHLKPEDFSSANAVRAQWDMLAPQHASIVAGLSDTELAEVITYDMPARGGVKHTARWEILAHVVNHGTDHRAQILSLLFQLGAPTVEQDLMFYLWDQ
jgi:uncharacterized damage-inducible protein DinB